MPTKQVTFSFPADAWDGIVESLTEYSYQAFIPNPDYLSDPATQPQQIANPLSREDAATQVIIDFVEGKYKDWGIRTGLAPAQVAATSAAEARAAEVRAATTITVTEAA